MYWIVSGATKNRKRVQLLCGQCCFESADKMSWVCFLTLKSLLR